MLNNKNLFFWKYLTNFWSLLTLVIFSGAFLVPGRFDHVLSTIAIIYGSVLVIYVGSKEITRWQEQTFVSRHSGEIFILLWTLLFVTFIFMALGNAQYKIPSEFTATYITVLGIFAISQKSKAMKG